MTIKHQTLLFSAHIYCMEGKSSTQNAQIRRFFAYLPIDNVLQMSVCETDEDDGSDRENF